MSQDETTPNITNQEQQLFQEMLSQVKTISITFTNTAQTGVALLGASLPFEPNINNYKATLTVLENITKQIRDKLFQLYETTETKE